MISGNTVIVIDDDQIVLNILGQYLQKNGFKTLVFTNPFEATEYLVRAGKEHICGDIAAVISDFNMPDLTGGDILAVLRGIEDLKNVPFFILTGFSEHQVMPHVMDLKLGGILKKPLMMSSFQSDFLAKIAN